MYTCITVSQGSDITKGLFVLEFNLDVFHFSLNDFTFKDLLLFFKLKNFNVIGKINFMPFFFEVTCSYLLLIFYFLLLFFLYTYMYIESNHVC